MDKKNSHINPLLQKYFDNTCTPEELLSLFAYFAVANEEELRLQVRTLIDVEEIVLQEEQNPLQTIKDRLLEKIDMERPRRRSDHFSNYIKYAAAIVLVVCLTKVLVGHFSTVPVKTARSLTENRQRTRIFQQQNFSSDVRALKFADGSTVMLYPQSIVLYNGTFGKDNRSIELIKGRARFDVKPVPGLPFVVKSNHLITNVLGTVFDVDLRNKNYADVKLLKGKVVVYSGRDFKKETYLMPGKKLRLDLKSGVVDVTTAKNVQAFKQIPSSKAEEPIVSLSFRNTAVSETFSTLEKHYKVSIDYEVKDVKNLYFTGNLEEDMPLSTALSIICTMNNLFFDQQGDTILISKKKQ
ncbi:FecR family protein [Olivibacter sp. CPCC 100613]|uniref:FecR family protein n=1 Tax=Olivibacter sp. CPCC 100613 TaxID=3079931 RepID=UPI002FFB72E9